jgi:hypothetical protein
MIHSGLFSFLAKEEGLYRLAIENEYENGFEILLINDENNIQVNADPNNYESYTIKGSKGSEALNQFDEIYPYMHIKMSASTTVQIGVLLDHIHSVCFYLAQPEEEHLPTPAYYAVCRRQELFILNIMSNLLEFQSLSTL